MQVGPLHVVWLGAQIQRGSGQALCRLLAAAWLDQLLRSIEEFILPCGGIHNAACCPRRRCGLPLLLLRCHRLLLRLLLLPRRQQLALRV